MWRLIFASILILAVATSCAKPQTRTSQLPEFYRTHRKCIGSGNDGVKMWRCATPPERVQIAAGQVYYEDPIGSVGMSPLGNLRTVKSDSYEPILVRELHTGKVCSPQYSKARVLSRDNKDGEMRIPVTCSGRRGELIWHMDGEFSRYIGLRWV
jgi:hypothetical protein